MSAEDHRNNEQLSVSIKCQSDIHANAETKEFRYQKYVQGEKPTALDVLLQAQEKELPDLAYRYGCRNKLCGVCTIDINGKPRLACRTKVKQGDTLAPMKTLPLISDLVVNRASINLQLRGRLPLPEQGENTGLQSLRAPDDVSYFNLNKCIECYACLEGCPLHEQNVGEKVYKKGNPYSFLKLQRSRVDSAVPEAGKKAALDYAQELGLDNCIDCGACKCGVGINLVKDVIQPLLKAADNETSLD